MPVWNICSLELPTLSLSSMRFVMRSQRMDLGPDGRTECCKLLKGLHVMIPDFLEKIKILVGMYRKIQHNPQEEITSLYLWIENTFYHLYLERERTTEKTITASDDSSGSERYITWNGLPKRVGRQKVRENVAAWKGNCRYHQEFFIL